MKRTLLSALLSVAALVLMMYSPAQAHVVCGDRVFPATLTMDDPGMGDYISAPSQNLSGWDNTTVTLKDQHPCTGSYEKHELAWSLGLIRLIPGSGSKQLSNAGAIATVGSTSPTFYIGKGLGDLPVGYLRPLAVIAEFSRNLSDNPMLSPNSWSYAASLQYSMPYVQQHIKALSVPNFITHLTPLVEVSMTSPDAGLPTGTIAPGILYDAQ